MIYTRNGKYYIKKTERMLLIDASLDDNGNINLVPTSQSVPMKGADIMTYSIITPDEIKANLTKKPEKVVEKPKKTEEPEVENKFAGLFGDKTTKTKKTI